MKSKILSNSLLAVALAALLPAVGHAQTILWDFSADNLQGWTVLNGFENFAGNGINASQNATNNFAHDGAHPTFLLESPAFFFNYTNSVSGGGAIRVATEGGQGAQGGSVGNPANPAAVLAFNGGNSANNGLKGVGLLNTSTGNYDAYFYDPGNGGGVQTVSQTTGGLSGGGVDLNQQYRLHIFEHDQGGWGWTRFNQIEVAAQSGPETIEIAGDNNIGTDTLFGEQSNETFDTKLTGARRVRLTQNLGETFQIAELQAFEDGTGTNEALASNGGTAGALDTAFGTSPSDVNDGNTNGAFGGGSVWHSASAAGTWVEVNLNEDVDLTSVDVFGRTDCCQNRQDNFRLDVFDNGGSIIFTQDGNNLGAGEFLSITTGDLLSADLTANLVGVNTYVFEIGSSDTLEVDNPDPSIFNTILSINDATIEFELLGPLGPPRTEQILIADEFVNFSGATIILPEGIGGQIDTSNLFVDGTIAITPEPASIAIWSIIGLGVAGFGYRRLRRKQ